MIKESLWLSFASAAVLVLASCASNKNNWEMADTGPFDEHGNYRDDWADDPTKWRRPGGSKPADTRVAKNDQPPANAVPLPPSSPRTTSTPPKPKVAYKPKPKPAATRYTVKKGDSLYAIAQRNKTTVSALQKANGISGSLIRPGQALVIPRR